MSGDGERREANAVATGEIPVVWASEWRQREVDRSEE